MEAVTLARLKRRNRDARAACTLTNSCRQVLAQHAALQEKSARQQQRLDLQEKEKHEMAADLQLLQQNEANAGVSSEHIQLLQQQLELAKGEAHAEVARLRASLGEATASEAALRTENERLLQKLMDALALQAHAMDSEVQAHEEQRVSSEVQAEQHGQGAVWAVPQLGSCASSGHAWRLRAARYSQEEAGPLGAQPFPRLFELVASNAADFPAFEYAGGGAEGEERGGDQGGDCQPDHGGERGQPAPLLQALLALPARASAPGRACSCGPEQSGA